LEKGVMGEVRLADVLVAPSADAGKEVFRLAAGSPAAGFWAADREMKVSTHFAIYRRAMVSNPSNRPLRREFARLTDNGLLVLATVVELEQLSCAQGEDHALIIFLQVIIYLGGNQSSQSALRE
jgi:hypothetical protein